MRVYTRYMLFTAMSALLLSSSCKSVDMKDKKFIYSSSVVEIGAIGYSKGTRTKAFDVHALPRLDKKIRLSVAVLPFNKKIHGLYVAKKAYDQSQPQIAYIDSIPQKPEFVLVELMDITGLAAELNTVANADLNNYLKDAGNTEIVTAVALSLSTAKIEKIRSADSYYLACNANKKYFLSLYKLGKSTETIDLQEGTPIAYRLGKFCWSADERGNWRIADILDSDTSCKGNTVKKIKEKEIENLYKL